MVHVQPIQEHEASTEVKEVFDEIKQKRKVDEVNNFWKYLANHPPTLRRTWESLKEVMQSGALDPLQGNDLCCCECLKQLRILHPFPQRGSQKKGNDR